MVETASPTDTIAVVIVEDEDLYRDLLRIGLAQQPRLEVRGVFRDAATALAAIPTLQPRVALLDIELPGGMNGVQLARQLRRRLPQLGIVLLSNHRDLRFVSALSEEEMTGWSYLLKKSVSDAAALARAIEGAAAGFIVLDPQLVTDTRGASARTRAGEAPRPRLTPRQQEILGLIAQGYSNAAIAQRLHLAEKSVQNQINLLYQQLGIDSQDPALHPRVQAVLAYLREASRM